MRTITLDDIDRYVAEHQQDESAYVKPASAYLDDVIKAFRGQDAAARGCHLPWTKAHGRFDIRPCEVTVWMGYNGHGKSMVLGQVVNHLMLQGQKVCIASLEMRPTATLKRMTRQGAGTGNPTDAYIAAYHGWLDEKLWIYDQHGSTPPQRIINLCRYVTSLGVNHVVIDSLMKVVEDEDDHNRTKKFVNDLCILARDTGLHIHLVHHARKAEDEKRQPGKMDAKGTGAVSDLADNFVSVWWRKEPEADKPDFLLGIRKQRHGEYEGSIGLWFHADSMQFCETEHRRPRSLPLEMGEACDVEF